MAENFINHLSKLLKADNRLVDEENDIQINVLRDLVNNLDSQLIELLIADDKVREKFFIKVKDVYVFKQNDFIFYLDSKVLDGSYTQYANRIGLASGGKFLTDSTDYVLDFPYKDCVLEGGQSTEEGNDVYFEYDEGANDYVEKSAKRKEIFYNNIIAKDEIDRLLEPKAFQKVVRYDANGETIPTSFTRDAELNRQRGLPEDTITDNLIIKGNNLLALHSLEKEFKGKVKLIYIDPPYNTGNDGFVYNDRFNHSTWLTFMYNRLKKAKDLLKEDGVIFVQCDDKEQAYLKILMDAIFSRDNFVTTINCQMSTTQGMKVRSAQLGNIVKNTEYIHIYGKNGRKDIAINPLYDLRKDYDEHYNQMIKEDGSIRPLREFYDYSYPKDLNNKKPLSLKEAFIKSEEFAQFVKSNLEKIVCDDKVTGFNTSSLKLENKKFIKVVRNSKEYLITINGKGNVRQLLKLSDSWGKTDSYQNPEGLRKIRGDWWADFYLDMGNVTKEGDVLLQNGKKPERLIQQIIKMVSNENDLILDYHLGSGTTAAVAHKMNRQYIGVEQMDYVETISLQRLNKVIDGEQGGISKAQNWQGGGSFTYAELAKNNETAKERIDACNSLEEMLQLFEELNTRYFLDYNVRIKDFKENVVKEEAFINLSLARQKEIFKRMLDNNQLYVNLSEVEDARYKLSEDAIRLTKDFYQIKS